jgi:hypothetical protein
MHTQSLIKIETAFEILPLPMAACFAPQPPPSQQPLFFFFFMSKQLDLLLARPLARRRRRLLGGTSKATTMAGSSEHSSTLRASGDGRSDVHNRPAARPLLFFAM